MRSSRFNRLIGPAALVVGFMANMASHAQTPSVELSEHRTENGHHFHYLGTTSGTDVAIMVHWPSDWVTGSGPIATPYLGSKLMMNSGAGSRDAATLNADFLELNAKGEIDGEPDAMHSMLVVHPLYLDAATELGRDILIDNHLDDRWLERLRHHLREEHNAGHTDLAAQGWDVIRRAILGDGRLNDFLTLTPGSLIDDVTRDDIQAWHADTFTADNLVIVASGPDNLRVDFVGEAIDRMLEGLPVGDDKNDESIDADAISVKADGKTILLHRPDAERTVITIGGRLPPARGVDHIYDAFADFVLGSGRRARLLDAIRTKLRATYAADVVIGSYDRQTRMLYLDSEIDQRQVKDAYAAFRDTYETLRLEGITADEFERTREFITAKYQGLLREPESAATLLIDLLVNNDPMKEHITDIAALIETVTLDEINAAIQTRWPAFSDMIRVVITANDNALDSDCVITSVPDVDNC
ncbi:MAG: insulinase family protein [Alphaproteobacteria bacterium GM202ARS2]|nr:insulinase family protein [Alphaproteobacteria bacterium GM202ARS2]